MSNRMIHGLELLRGACALLVAIFHAMEWTGTPAPASWGLYSVYIFFVISGAVLAYNYEDVLNTGRLTPPRFLLRRFARLAPLYLACVLVPALLAWKWTPVAQLMNASLLFGFANPGESSMIVGGWSLGIEFVLYALFPILLTFIGSPRLALGALVVLIALRMLSTHLALEQGSLIKGWAAYTQPGSFLCFFFGGMVLARYAQHLKYSWVGLAAIPVLFAWSGSAESVLLGWRGLLCTILCIACVAAFFRAAQSRVIAWVSRFLGDVSYGLYLIHPILWAASIRFLPGLSAPARIALMLVGSIMLAWISLRVYERPMKRWILAPVWKPRELPPETEDEYFRRQW